MNPVTVTVTGNIAGTAYIVPYNKHDGLQRWRPPGSSRDMLALYTVSAYEVQVGGAHHRAIRFGLRNTGSKPQRTRNCDTRLSADRTCTPAWIPTYSPHSFAGTSRRGAWQLLPGKGFLIHEGPGPTQAGGSIGCVEILDAMWDDFLGEIEKAAGATCAQIGAAGRLTVKIEHATYPAATSVY
jgi:hypothetical protein